MISLRALRIAIAAARPDDPAVAQSVARTGNSGSGNNSSGSGSSRTPHETRQRLTALVELARDGDAEAFGQLYDHYVTSIYRFVYYRVGSRQLAEDLTSETFIRALRSIQRFTWQGRDFGAWLTTIARNLVADHHKSARTRLEFSTDDIPESRPPASAESTVLGHLDNENLLNAVNALAPEQRDCVLMRFIQELSVAQTAAALQRSEGAIKQLQFRAVRNLAKVLDADPSSNEPGSARS